MSESSVHTRPSGAKHTIPCLVDAFVCPSPVVDHTIDPKTVFSKRVWWNRRRPTD